MKLNEKIVMFCAFRYALGRMTYVVGAVCDELKRRYHEFDSAERQKYTKEIQEYQDKFGLAGWEFDNDEWNKIKWLFDSSRKRMIEVNYHNTDRWEQVEAVLGEDGKYYSIPEMKEYHTVRISE